MKKKSEMSLVKRGVYLSSQSEQKKQLEGDGERCKPPPPPDQWDAEQNPRKFWVFSLQNT